ncbi:MAG: alpha/beta hydrolase [Planctomycetota bacterium]|nr:alpha/beta hydrolase [Planctomycetota bacterium]
MRLLALLLCAACAATPADDVPLVEVPLLERVEHHEIDASGVKLHAVSLGEGPLVVMLHGFPDYWFTWRDLMEALAVDHQVVALDLRGYNRSAQPEGVANYSWPHLLGDVEATVKHFGAERATIVGHDWGGAISWQYAMRFPHRVERLVILNLPHPAGLMRELANNPEQQANSQYARDFQAPDAHERLSPEALASWVTDDDARAHYVEAFERSSIEGMLAYYKANFPASAGGAGGATPAPPPSFPEVQCPVLQIHGLDDSALLPGGLNDTWEWLSSDYTLVTIPGAGHFVQQDAEELVRRSVLAWIHR